MSDDDLTKYARWLCWAFHDPGHDKQPYVRIRVLSEYKESLPDYDADILQKIFDAELVKWNKKTEVEKEQYRNQQRVAHRRHLHKDEAA